MQTVAGGVPHPLVVSSRFGQGRVVVVLTDTMWRWRLAARGWSSELSPHDTFWTQLMDWLIPKEQDKENSSRIELFTERTNYNFGERPEIRAIVRTPTSGVKLPATFRCKSGRRTTRCSITPSSPPHCVRRAENRSAATAWKSIRTCPACSRRNAPPRLDGAEVSGETRFIVSHPATEITGKPIDREFLNAPRRKHRGKILHDR